MIRSIFNDTAAAMEITSIIWYSLCFIILGIVIAFTHKRCQNIIRIF